MGRVKPSAISKAVVPLRNAALGQAAKGAWLWASPALGGVGGVIAWLEGLSPTGVFLCAITAMALVPLALNQGRAFWAATSSHGKLSLRTITTELRVDPTTHAHLGYNVSFWFTNMADFEIEIEILEVRATIQDRTLGENPSQSSIHRIGPYGTFHYDYGVVPYTIDFDDIKSPLYGYAYISYDYGKPGKAGTKVSTPYRLLVYFDTYDGMALRTDCYALSKDEAA